MLAPRISEVSRQMLSVSFACHLERLQFIQNVEGSDREVSSGGASSMDVLRPEIGFAVSKFKFTYAYNAALTEPRIDDVNVHMLSVAIAWRIGRLPRDGEPGSHRSP